jgi:hypothetical protein
MWFLEVVRLDGKYRQERRLRAKVYFSLPQLLALDFYKAMREDFNRARRGKRIVIAKTCAKLLTLPNGGWPIKDFEIHVFNPYSTRDIIVVFGTAFDEITHTDSAKTRMMLLKYKGRDLFKKIEIARHRRETYIQRHGNDCYWNVRTLAERKGYMQWKRKPFMVDKKTFEPL